MAVTKIWAVHEDLNYTLDYCSNPDKTKLEAIEQVLLYASDKEKTLDENEESYAVTGINCKPETAAKEMTAVQKRFGKNGGIIAWHAYQSFKTGEVSAEECHRVGVETARKLWGKDYQVLVATHFNTGTYHNHFVVNSVGMWDGRKLEAKFQSYYDLRQMSDQICKEHGLTVVENPQRHKTSRSVYFAEKNGEPTRHNLMREAMDKALSMSSNWTDMRIVLRKMGYVFECNPNAKYATIRSLRSKKNLRTFRLGEQYGKEALREKLLLNQRDYGVTKRYYEFLKPYTREYVRANPPAETYYRKRDFYRKAPTVTGYLGFFQCVAIVFGIAPLYERHYEKPLSAECREACRWLDRYSEEVRLTCREKFETAEDIQKFIGKTDEQIDAVSYARQKVRNRQRNCKDPARLAKLKIQCADYTSVLSALRKEKRIACNILEDNPKLRELLAGEYDARLENDPYLSDREKQIERNTLLRNLTCGKTNNIRKEERTR